jgi:hypothetical protein
MPSYILRTIDPDLWARVKARSEAEGIPLRAIILKLLALYAEGALVIKADTRQNLIDCCCPDHGVDCTQCPIHGQP